MINSLCKNVIIQFLFAFTLVFSVQAQDPVYSQYYNVPILTNPAFAGNTIGANVAVMYRNQWPAIDNAYETYSITYDQQLKKNSGIGLYVTTDDAGNGAIKTTKFGGIYSYKIRINDDSYIKGALDIAYGQTNLDQSQLVFLDNLDPQFGQMTPGGQTFPTSENLINSSSIGYLDISSGVLLYTGKYYAGLSFKHMNAPTIDFIDSSFGERGNLPLMWSAHAGYQIDLEKSNKYQSSAFVSPNALFVSQGGFWQINVGALVNIYQVFGGLWYRHSGNNSDAVIASLGMRTGMFKVSYSFDYTVSELTIGSGGSHEISVALNFDDLVPKKSKYNDCLMLFR